LYGSWLCSACSFALIALSSFSRSEGVGEVALSAMIDVVEMGCSGMFSRKDAAVLVF